MLFFKPRFFVSLIFIALAFFVSFFWDTFFPFVLMIFVFILLLSLVEIILIWSKKNIINAQRVLPERMSNNDENWVELHLYNESGIRLFLKIREELPHQLNLRDFVLSQKLKPKEKLKHSYTIEPKTRGVYRFGNLNVYVSSPIGFIERRLIFKTPQEIKVYPSFKNLNEYDLKTLKTTAQYGIRKTRRIGHSLEFEQIKNYNRGDDIRHINWNSTAKRQQLMVNQYTDEKSKEVYCVLDNGRSMKFPFRGLSLLDYAVNSSLIILNNALQSQDRAGVVSFNTKVDQFLKAEQRPQYLQKIMEKLYSIEPQFEVSNFSNLYVYLKRMISHRALLFLFCNFENYDAFQRQLPYLQALNKSHVLVVVFFKNVEMEDTIENFEIRDAVQQAIIEKQVNEKRNIVHQLHRRNIQTILTSPDDLSIQLLNKYLEIKAKSLI